MASKKGVRRIIYLMILCMVLTVMPFSHAFGTKNTDFYDWTPTEKAWLESHRGETLKLGLDPLVGMDYYVVDGKARGYVINVVAILQRDMGIHIEIVDDYSWDETLQKLKDGQIDIVFGANATEARKQYMSFTAPLLSYPYNIYARKGGAVRTLGDLDGKTVGFMAGDAVSSEFPRIYDKIKYKEKQFETQLDAMESLVKGDIDAFVTDSGGITKKYAHDFSNVEVIADLTTFTSDMTLSTLKANDPLAQILDRILSRQDSEIQEAVDKAMDTYNRFIVDLSPEEERWLNAHPKIIVGAADDYLPFDYYKNGEYRGIAGDYLTAVADQVGLELEVVTGPFDILYDKARKKQIHLLNMAKTETRMSEFLFTNAFSEERDEIFGRRSSDYLQDIYELENKRVAVVKGYWHKDYLLKNLSDVLIVETKDLKESLKLVAEGKADYLIENPTVANYYIDGLGYSTIIEKGSTSQDSFLYFGIPRGNEQLVSILNKAMPLVRYEKIKSTALQEVPAQQNVTTIRLLWLLLALIFILFGVVYYLVKLFRELINQKTKQKMLEEREKLIYQDGLTGLYNRMYFNVKERDFEVAEQPLTFLMIDLNGLKFVNDTYGHAYGDMFITYFTECLHKQFFEDVVIRMGGDEFLVVIEGADVESLENRLLALEAYCKERPIYVRDEVFFTPSAAWGWAIKHPAHMSESSGMTMSVNECISQADQMMYQHKASLKRRRSDHVMH